MNKVLPAPIATHLKYRPDIDGLRGASILAVILFHAFPEWITGGYVGVSIFFVISGYLISSILFKSLDSNSFSFISFYIRRIRRIFPALILVLVATFISGWFYLLASEFKQLGAYIAGGAAFVDNFIAWQEVNYFDSSAELKPLLHLWSLGIEEQFYIVWPIVVWVIWKRKINGLYAFALIFFLLFALNIQGMKYDPLATFYSPWTRFWEIISGALMAYIHIYHSYGPEKIRLLLSHKWLLNLSSALGLALIFYGIFFFTKKTLYPGWSPLIPVLGSLLLISQNERGWVNDKILSSKALVWFGSISYPLYLWHWVILSFARVITGEEPRIRIKIGLLVLSIILSWVTCRYIERPIRFGGLAKAKSLLMLFMLATIGYVGFNTYERNGLPFRAYNQSAAQYLESMVRTPRQDECFDIPYAHNKKDDWFCEIGVNSEKPDIFAYGDSHALSLMPALEAFGIAENKRILFASASGCPPLLLMEPLGGSEKERQEFNCRLLNERVYAYVKNNNIKNVILIGRWSYYTKSISTPTQIVYLVNAGGAPIVDAVASEAVLASSLKNTVNLYKKIGVNVFIIEDSPAQTNPLQGLRLSTRPLSDIAINKHSVTLKVHLENQARVNGYIKSTGADIINFDSILCTDSLCPLVENGRFLYFDGNHLSIYGAKKVGLELSRAFLNQ